MNTWYNHRDWVKINCSFFFNARAGFLDGGDGSPANWTGLVDIEEEATSNTTDPCESPSSQWNN